MADLTDKQQAFINEYLQCWNAAEAARRAGYSVDTARSIGSENLTKPDIKAEIDRRVAEMTMTADEALIRLGDMARASMEDFTDIIPGIRTGLYLNFEKAKERGKLHLIKKLKYNAAGLPELELHDAQSALIQIAKHHGLFKDEAATVINNTNQTNITFERRGPSTLREHPTPGTIAGDSGEQEI